MVWGHPLYCARQHPWGHEPSHGASCSLMSVSVWCHREPCLCCSEGSVGWTGGVVLSSSCCCGLPVRWQQQEGPAPALSLLPGWLSHCSGTLAQGVCVVASAVSSGLLQLLVVCGELHSIPQHLLQQCLVPLLQCFCPLLSLAPLVLERLQGHTGALAPTRPLRAEPCQQPWFGPQPSLPTCCRCCLQACISCLWPCSRASRCCLAASRSLHAASRLRCSTAISCCK